MADAVASIEKTTQVPEQFAFQSVLAAANFAAQSYWHWDPKLFGKGKKPLGLYQITLSASGTRKSAVFEKSQMGINRWLEEWEEFCYQDKKRFAAEDSLYQDALKEYKAALKTDPSAEPPKAPRLAANSGAVVNRGTTNGFINIINRTPVMGLFTDEGAQVFAGHSTKDDSGTMEFITNLVNLWDDGRVSKNTGMDEVRLRNRSVSLFLLSQPTVLAKVMNNQTLMDQGFLHRVLVMNIPEFTTSPTSALNTDLVSDISLGRFGDACYKLLKGIQFERHTEYQYFDNLTHCLNWTKSGLEMYDVINRHLHAELENHKGDTFIEPFLKRGLEHIGRIAGTFVAIEGRDSFTDTDLLAALQVFTIFLDEKINLNISDSGSLDNIGKILVEWISSQTDKTKLSKSNLSKFGPKKYRSLPIEQRTRLLKLMTDEGHIERRVTSDGSFYMDVVGAE